jgi:hypothetical protein
MTRQIVCETQQYEPTEGATVTVCGVQPWAYRARDFRRGHLLYASSAFLIATNEAFNPADSA